MTTFLIHRSTTLLEFVKPRLSLNDRQRKIAFTLWNQDQDVDLNEYQKHAIMTAWNNEFTLIQGPPGMQLAQIEVIMTFALATVGTGKSVTGAHLAYALVMKLRMEHAQNPAPDKRDSDAPMKPCVMYCGPSHQSVNVVLGMFLLLLYVHVKIFLLLGHVNTFAYCYCTSVHDAKQRRNRTSILCCVAVCMVVTQCNKKM